MRRELDSESIVRLGLLAVSGYLGCVLGDLAVSEFRLSWVMWSPVRYLAAVICSVLSPWGWLLLLATGVVGFMVMKRQVPPWVGLLFAVFGALMTALTIKMWRV